MTRVDIHRRRTSIASYRAEATFFKTVAGSAALDAIVPHAFWVHVDDRLGGGEETGTAAAAGTGGTEADATIVEALRESCFMMITGGWVLAANML